MATLGDKSESCIASEALDLLDGLVFGLHEIVYEIAEQFARERQKPADGAVPTRPVLIEPEDVRTACRGVIDYLRRLAQSRQFSGPVEPALDRLEQCLEGC